jgi:hypothetical protein
MDIIPEKAPSVKRSEKASGKRMNTKSWTTMFSRNASGVNPIEISTAKAKSGTNPHFER